MEKKDNIQLIVDTIKEKSCMKQDVYQNIQTAFEYFQQKGEEVIREIQQKVASADSRIILDYNKKSQFDFELTFAGDILVFHMHTNIFKFDTSHAIYQTSYVQEDENRAYCGMINVYNFLADSIRYNRDNDLGYLVARIFVNKDNHFFVEGKRQMGVLYNNFSTETISPEKVKNIIESAILFSLSFDLYTPPYYTMQEVSVSQIKETSSLLKLSTGKRLGFKFGYEEDEIF
ncbi:MAG: hypothetical protein D6707_09645 [Bacteroidetes bacterium]|nr:MAG: hypothetical protein D6707_09645 [Bacteroidota bacterium]